MSLTEMVSSLIWRSRRMTSRCRKNISASNLYHLSKYCWQIFLNRPRRHSQCQPW